MQPVSLAVVFVIAWFLVFLAVLPIGVQGQWEDDSTIEGTEEGAPKEPMMAKKAIWATIGGTLLTVVAYFAIPRLLSWG